MPTPSMSLAKSIRRLIVVAEADDVTPNVVGVKERLSATRTSLTSVVEEWKEVEEVEWVKGAEPVSWLLKEIWGKEGNKQGRIHGIRCSETPL